MEPSSSECRRSSWRFSQPPRGLLCDPVIDKRIVPVITDEASTFGFDPLLTEFGIHAAFGKKYDSFDAAMLLAYRRAKDGQILQEGITDAGGMSSFVAAEKPVMRHGDSR